MKSIIATTTTLILVGAIMAGEPFMSIIVQGTSLRVSGLPQVTDLPLLGLRLPDPRAAPDPQVWADRPRDPPEGGAAGKSLGSVRVLCWWVVY